MKVVLVAVAFVFSTLSLWGDVFAAPVSTQVRQAQEPLSKADFSVRLHNQVITLGEPWNTLSDTGLGQSLSDDFVGDVKFGEESYKFYHHQYNGFDIYTSNLWWDKAGRDFDAYIIAQISLKSPVLKTHRGAYIGMTTTELTHLYGEGKRQHNNGRDSISYFSGSKHLTFKVVGDKISSITFGFDN